MTKRRLLLLIIVVIVTTQSVNAIRIRQSNKSKSFRTERQASRRRISIASQDHNYHHHLLNFVIASEFLTRSSNFLRQTVRDVLPTVHHSRMPTTIIIIINLMVHFSWRHASSNLDRIKWMIYHFGCPNDVSSAARAERPHAVLTHAFFHMDGHHLFSNVVNIWVLSPYVVEMLGYRRFSYFYIGSVYASTLFGDRIFMPLEGWLKQELGKDKGNHVGKWVTTKLTNLRRTALQGLFPVLATPFELGASGTVYALAMLLSLSIGSTWFILFLVCFECSQLSKDDKINHAGHLGGYLYGFLIWCLLPKTVRSSIDGFYLLGYDLWLCMLLLILYM